MACACCQQGPLSSLRPCVSHVGLAEQEGDVGQLLKERLVQVDSFGHKAALILRQGALFQPPHEVGLGFDELVPCGVRASRRAAGERLMSDFF